MSERSTPPQHAIDAHASASLHSTGKPCHRLRAPSETHEACALQARQSARCELRQHRGATRPQVPREPLNSHATRRRRPPPAQEPGAFAALAPAAGCERHEACAPQARPSVLRTQVWWWCPTPSGGAQAAAHARNAPPPAASRPGALAVPAELLPAASVPFRLNTNLPKRAQARPIARCELRCRCGALCPQVPRERPSMRAPRRHRPPPAQVCACRARRAAARRELATSLEPKRARALCVLRCRCGALCPQ
eukprot:6808096-Prymnesium_polylepis.1